MSEPVPVAVVGAGHLGSIHARVLSEMTGAALRAVVDLDGARADDVASRFGAQGLSELAAIPDDVRAAVVATPTSSHRDVAIALMERGIDVLVEKPIASRVAEARDLVETADRLGRILMVGHSERFNPVILALRELELEPRFIDAQRVSPFSFRSADVGVVLDMMIHDIDIILHLVGVPVRAVHAVGVPVIGTSEDLANARLVFENGAVANATASRVALKTERVIRIFSRDCYVTLDFQKKVGRVIRRGPALESGDVDLASLAAEGMKNPLAFMSRDLVRVEEIAMPDVEPLEAEDRAFLDAVLSRAAPPVTGRHGLLALETAKRIEESIAASIAAFDADPVR